MKLPEIKYTRIDNVLVDTQGYSTELFIGIPGIARIWLKENGTFKIDIPNEKAMEVNAKAK